MLRIVAVKVSEHDPPGIAPGGIIKPSGSRQDLHVVVSERWHFRVLFVVTGGLTDCKVMAANASGDFALLTPVASSDRTDNTLPRVLAGVEQNAEGMSELAAQWIAKLAAESAKSAAREDA